MSDSERTASISGDGVVVPQTVAVPVRMSLRPPPRLTTGSDYNLWFTHFELHVREAKIPDAKRVKELLPLVDDKLFRAISQMGLVESTDYAAVKECLRLRYGQSGTELEWQFKFQGRIQKT